MNQELKIIVKGEVVESNLPAYQSVIDHRLSEINTSPATDEEFGEAEENVKTLKQIEDEIDTKTEEALKEASTLNDLLTALSETKEKVRSVRLDLNRAVKAKKETIRQGMIVDGVENLAKEAQISGVQARKLTDCFEEAVKGKRTLQSMQKAVDHTVEEWATRIVRNRECIEQFLSASPDHASLVPDRSNLEMNAGGVEHLNQLLTDRSEKAKLQREKQEALERERAAKREAEEARKAAEVKKEEPAPAPDPEPASPKVEQPQTNQVSEEEEWAGFVAHLKSGFSIIRDARNGLTHPGNIEKANAFSQAVNAAWKGINK